MVLIQPNASSMRFLLSLRRGFQRFEPLHHIVGLDRLALTLDCAARL